METYVIANNKPSERSMKARILKHHLLPVFGDMPLDAIKMHPIEVLKASLLAKGLSRNASGAERALRSDRLAQLWAAGGQRSERCGLK